MTSGNSSATLVLVTGLLSVGMAAFGYYYLQRNTKKMRALTNNSSEAGKDNGQTTVSETIEKTVASIETPMPRASLKKSPQSPTTNVEKVVEAPSEVMESPHVEITLSPKEILTTNVEKVVEPSVKVVESSLVAEALTEVTSSPKKYLKTNVEKVVKPPSEVVEPSMEVVESPSSPKKTSKTNAEKVVEPPSEVVEPSMEMVESTSSPKKTSKTNVEKAVEPLIEVVEAPSSPKKTPKSSGRSKKIESPDLVLTEPLNTSSKKAPETPRKDVENRKQTIESPRTVAEQTEVTTIEQQKQDPDRSIKTPERSMKKTAAPEKATELATALEDLESVTTKVSEDFIVAQALAETASAFTDKVYREMHENIALEQEYVQVELTQSMTLSQSTNIKDAAVETDKVVLTSAATKDEESNVDEKQEHAQVSSQPIEPASAEPLVDVATVTLASPKSPDTTPVSWESITLSPETKAIPAQEPTPLSLEAPAESAKFAEPLLINVPPENPEEPAENEHASSPVDSGGSTPGKRNRNRSKKSKSKKKKGKKHPKLQG